MWRGGPSVFQHVHQERGRSRGRFRRWAARWFVIRGTEEFAHLDAVKADNAHILRNTPPHVCQSADDAHCDGIGHAEDGGGVALRGEKGAGGIVSALERKARLDETLILKRHACLLHGRHSARVTEREGVVADACTAENGDFPMPRVQQHPAWPRNPCAGRR